MSDATDRMWTTETCGLLYLWHTPAISVRFGRYWRVSWGIGPFFGSFGYVELF